MHIPRLAASVAALTLSSVALLAQGLPSTFGGVNSTYGLGSSTFGSVQYTIAINLDYSDGLTPNQYISQSQLTSDYQAFVAAYPNPGDAVEAILASAASSFATKYPQFASVTLGASSTSPLAQIEASAASLGGLANSNRNGNKAVKKLFNSGPYKQ
ncbi:MAG TPA: hypothetical protein VKU01_04985 [Bryobacteraceae bacterium]|nr:hypothetical protein [Bryobacteraceae bacterium]